jgi:predicted acylesterase/phospholipase RssA
MLAELGVIDANTKIAGASSGALVTLARCTGTSADDFMTFVQQLSNECRSRTNCQGQLDAALRRKLQQTVSADAFRRCTGRATFSVSIGKLGGPTNLLVDSFTSTPDLLAAACASSFIPAWSGTTPHTMFRGQPAFDGGFSNSQPCPPGVKYCIKIASRNPPW